MSNLIRVLLLAFVLLRGASSQACQVTDAATCQGAVAYLAKCAVPEYRQSCPNLCRALGFCSSEIASDATCFTIFATAAPVTGGLCAKLKPGVCPCWCAASPPSPPSPASAFIRYRNLDYIGNNLPTLVNTNQTACEAACLARGKGCAMYEVGTAGARLNMCYLKSAVPATSKATSGIDSYLPAGLPAKSPSPPPPSPKPPPPRPMPPSPRPQPSPLPTPVNVASALVAFRNALQSTSEVAGPLSDWSPSSNPCTPTTWSHLQCHATPRGLVPDMLDLSWGTWGGHAFQGPLPPQISLLTQLVKLRIDGNLFTGTLPSSLSTLKQLTYLEVGSNSFSGSLPASLSALSNLQFLSVAYNNLAGSLPASLSVLTSLVWLDVEWNHFTGSLPPSVSRLTNLVQLYANHNSFEGNIDSLGTMALLQSLDLSVNSFDGTIPAGFNDMANLTTVWIDNNMFIGNLPASLCWGKSTGTINLQSDLECA